MRQTRRRSATSPLPAALALALAAGAALGVQPAGDTLDLDRVTLYRSGVGSFEWNGLIDGDADVSLRFDADQINDILKSMVLVDRNGGRIEAVGYNSKEPLERRLASFAIDVRGAASLAGLLRQLVGAPVSLDVLGQSRSGTVLGVEGRMQPGGEGGEPVETLHVNLITPQGIITADLSMVSNLRILDDRLADELRLALEALAEQRAENVKSVDLRFRGAGAREVTVAYVHETPVWKTSYRLVLPNATGEPGDTINPTVQGWAIVENTTDEDWQDVRLRLVSGQPVSFVMDLYEPLFLRRPVVPVPAVAAAAPKTYAPGHAAERAVGAESPEPIPFEQRLTADDWYNSAGPRGRGLTGDIPFLNSGAVGGGLTAEDLQRYAAGAQAAGAEIGEQFVYELEAPVTIERRRSAMLPILDAGLEGRRVSIYSVGGNARNPLRGVEIKNTSGSRLMPGPVAVYDAGAFAGDAQVGGVAPGERRLLAYAVDLDVTVETSQRQENVVAGVRIVDGVVRRRVEQRRGVDVTLTSADAGRGRVVVVEIPKIAGFELADGRDADSATTSDYRFEVELNPAGRAELGVSQRRIVSETVSLASESLPQLRAYAADGSIPASVREAIERAADLRAAVVAAEDEARRLEAERRSIADDQARLRQNLASVPGQSDLGRRYLAKLDEQETRLERIAEERRTADERVREATRRLEEYLRGLDVG